jgi:hypothetical protein
MGYYCTWKLRRKTIKKENIDNQRYKETCSEEAKFVFGFKGMDGRGRGVIFFLCGVGRN